VALLSREFLVVVLLALTIASPLSFFFMRDWLQTFAFHIEIDWKVFVIAGLTTMFIALFTVGIRAIKAATANPVDSLRNE
jgi:putative ABC transport system permease protein